ncbi:MAG TPA: SHOCT domain-containing protein [Solirubrobacteraceae bacterium]|nr:SHOCT domain-containing protein [Solirubrobacteraceae bacterium]
MVGGAGYAAGKRRARTEQHEYDQDAAIGQQAPPPAAAPPQAAAPAPAAMSEADRIQALKNLKELLDTGVLTQAEFDAQKQKLLNG